MKTLQAIASVLCLCLAAERAGALDAALWDALLSEHTREVTDVAGVRVDYAALARDPRWPELLAGLAGAEPPEGRPAELAFWLNAYNVLAIDVVVRNQPVDSIRDVGSLLRPVWKRPAGRAAGRHVTLDEIEHEILRPLGDPRIHAAIVCASTSCPSLRRSAFRPEPIDAQLDEAVARFLSDPRKGARVTEAGDALRVSRIFRWFDEDFESAGGVQAWLAPRLSEPARSWLGSRGSDARLVYFDYDWSLNGVQH